MATDKQTAVKVADTLKNEGILVKTREVMKSKKHGCCIEILVPESEAQEAQKVILEKNL
jgi:DNA topoisomerase VI subunit B